jgi:hypothetical protein
MHVTMKMLMPMPPTEVVQMTANAAGDESSHTYCFGASRITLSRICDMVEKGYFPEGEA